MKTLNFEIDVENGDFSCKYCQEALKYYKKLLKRHKGYYGTVNIKKQEKIKGIVLRPDYNSNGILNHWHIDIEE